MKKVAVHLITITMMIVISLAVIPAAINTCAGTAEVMQVCAEDGDVASGELRGVPWRITSDYDLLIGEDGKEYTLYGIDFYYANLNPWFSYRSKIKSAKVCGTIHSRGELINLFNGLSEADSIDLRGLDTSKTTSMQGLIGSCTSLKSIDISGLDTGNCTSMKYMFYHCSSLETIDVSGFDTGKVVGMAAMFNGCGSLRKLNLSSFDTSQVNDMSEMFRGCSSLSDVSPSSFDTSHVWSMKYMFADCSSLTNVDLSSFDTGNVTDMSRMFENCKSLSNIDISHFDTRNVENMYGLFSGCVSLKSVDVSHFDTRKVGNMNHMFYNCKKLTSLDLSTFKVVFASMYDIFKGCKNIKLLSVGPVWDFDIKNAPVFPVNMIGDNVFYAAGTKMPELEGESYYRGITYKSTKIRPLDPVRITGIKGGSKSFTAKWKKASKKERKRFSGYQIQYSLDVYFQVGVHTNNTTKKSASKVKITGVKGNEQYCVRLRRFRKSGGKTIYSAWSNVKCVNIK